MGERVGIAGFTLSMIGATYQLMSLALAYAINAQTPFYFYILLNYLGISGLSLSSLVVFWAASHLVESGGSRRAAWPSIILALGVAGLGNLLVEYITPFQTGTFGSQPTFPTGVFLVLLPSSLILIIGGILSFVPVMRQQRQ